MTEAGAAEVYSHEANGHALLYIRNGGDHLGASHNRPIGQPDLNKELVEMIAKSRYNTVQNMKNP